MFFFVFFPNETLLGGNLGEEHVVERTETIVDLILGSSGEETSSFGS